VHPGGSFVSPNSGVPFVHPVGGGWGGGAFLCGFCAVCAALFLFSGSCGLIDRMCYFAHDDLLGGSVAG
jgi:hypothetical protein